MKPVGQNVFIEVQQRKAGGIITEQPVYQHATVTAISPDVNLPLQVGDEIVVIRGKAIIFGSYQILNTEFVQLIKNRQ